VSKQITILFTVLLSLSLSLPLCSQDKAYENLQEYMKFSDYSAGIIIPEQLTKEFFDTVQFIDTRTVEEFEQGTIPGAINIEWREVFSRIDEIPKKKTTIMFCNTGSLSAQAAFALRVAGYENVLLMQTGFIGWQQNAPYKP
jgi:rhodanese-related sulfurtransferase